MSKGIHLDFPASTHVAISGPEAPADLPSGFFTVRKYDLLTQSYSVCPFLDGWTDRGGGCSPVAEPIPAAAITPVFWKVEDPVEKATALVTAHQNEKRRLAEVQALDAQLPAGLLTLPVGA